jgi:hypothetical protein
MTPLFKKLNFKSQDPVLVVNAPESFEQETKAILQFTTIVNDPELLEACSFIMAFVTQQSEIDALAPLLSKKLEGDGVLWFCYPKGSSKKYKCDFNRDTGWSALAKEGFEGVRMVAIDKDWSALRFRKVQYIKTMTRNFAQTDAGKEKVHSSKNQ